MSENQEESGSVNKVKELCEGERVLFGDRATPLEVKGVEKGEAKLEGPQGGEYLLYDEEDAKHPLVAKPDNRRYSSYAENLRKVGEWRKKGEKTWQHTGSGAEISLTKNSAGFWTLKTRNFDEKLDLPKYGFSSLQSAEEMIDDILKKYVEG